MGMFNIYDETVKEPKNPTGGINFGNNSLAAMAYQAGAGMGGAAMQGMGFKTPEQQKQEALLQARSQFPDPKTALPVIGLNLY